MRKNKNTAKKWHPFWHWFCFGSGEASGAKRLASWWIIGDILIATLVVSVVEDNVRKIASIFIVPAASTFIGVAIAIVNTAQSILISRTLRELAARKRGGIDDYVYGFLLSILVNLVVVMYWLLFGLFDPGRNVFIDICIGIGVILTMTMFRVLWRTILGFAMFVFAYHESSNSGNQEPYSDLRSVRLKKRIRHFRK